MHAAGQDAHSCAVGLGVYREVPDGLESHTSKHGRGPVQPLHSVAPVNYWPAIGQDFGPDL